MSSERNDRERAQGERARHLADNHQPVKHHLTGWRSWRRRLAQWWRAR